MEKSFDLLDRPIPTFDVRLSYGELSSQFGDLRLPPGPGPFPVAVGLHGGWWRVAHGLDTHAHLCAALTRSGIATWNVEYGRLGETAGGWPETMRDAGRAIDFLRHLTHIYPLDLSRIVTVGFSAGGQLAIWATHRHRFRSHSPFYVETPIQLKAAVSLAGAVDLRRCFDLRLSNDVVRLFIGGGPDEVPERYLSCSPIDLLPSDVPVELIHGTDDTSVPHEVSVRYYEAARNGGSICQLQLLDRVQHFELIDPLSRAWPTVRSTIEAALNAPSPLD